MAKRTKQNGRFTEPDLPPKEIVREGIVTIVHYYRSGDHGPPHLHVREGSGANVKETRIGQNGRPLATHPPLTPAQQTVIQNHISKNRRAVRRIGRWYWFDKL